jgi:hypothetical protein
VKGLGRKVPKDFTHVEKYPLRLGTIEAPTKPVPVISGVNWYRDFDKPIWKPGDRKFWVGLNSKSLGSIRGGHCICIPHKTSLDLPQWYSYYDQGEEGACVGFGSSRAMSLLNRKMYNARWWWNIAKDNDEWPETHSGDNEGTSVRAAMDIGRTLGIAKKDKTTPIIDEGISANRWARRIDDAFSVLQNPLYQKLGAMPFFNNWGKEYPHIVWMPCETWSRLMDEDGEFTMFTDR